GRDSRSRRDLLHRAVPRRRSGRPDGGRVRSGRAGRGRALARGCARPRLRGQLGARGPDPGQSRRDVRMRLTGQADTKGACGADSRNGDGRGRLRVLVLTCEEGEGHSSAARALEADLSCHEGVDVVVRDALRGGLGRVVPALARDAYRVQLRALAWTYGL